MTSTRQGIYLANRVAVENTTPTQICFISSCIKFQCLCDCCFSRYMISNRSAKHFLVFYSHPHIYCTNVTFSPITSNQYWHLHGISICLQLACVAGVQRGGRGKLNASAKRNESVKRDRWDLVGIPYEIPTITLRTRIQLPPPSPLYAGHTG